MKILISRATLSISHFQLASCIFEIILQHFLIFLNPYLLYFVKFFANISKTNNHNISHHCNRYPYLCLKPCLLNFILLWVVSPLCVGFVPPVFVEFGLQKIPDAYLSLAANLKLYFMILFQKLMNKLYGLHPLQISACLWRILVAQFY